MQGLGAILEGAKHVCRIGMGFTIEGHFRLRLRLAVALAAGTDRQIYNLIRKTVTTHKRLV